MRDFRNPIGRRHHSETVRTTATRPRRSVRLALENLEGRELLTGLQYGGGPLIQNVDAQPIFLGRVWNTDPSTAQIGRDLVAFLQDLTNSSYIDMFSEYDARGQRIGRGRAEGALVYQGDIPQGANIYDSQIRNFLNAGIVNGQLPAADGDKLYVVYTPPGAVVTDDGQPPLANGQYASSANLFNGYHQSFTDSQGQAVYYAVLPFPGSPNGANPSLSAFQNLTEASSHEIAEAITDPDTRTGWRDYNDTGKENGDLAEGHFGVLDGYVVQAEWSNRVGGPALPSNNPATNPSNPNPNPQPTSTTGLRSLISTYNRATSTFYIQNVGAVQFGQGTLYGGDPVPVAGDFRGDGNIEIGVYQRGTSIFYIRGIGAFQFGQGVLYGGDPLPIVADFNHSGHAELGVYQRGSSTFFVAGVGVSQFGQGTLYGGDPVPVAGDFRGDGNIEVGVYQRGTSTFYVAGVGAAQFGQGTLYGGDPLPIVGDFTGVGHAELGVLQRGTSTFYVAGVGVDQFGQGILYGGDPLPLAIPYRPSNNRASTFSTIDGLHVSPAVSESARIDIAIPMLAADRVKPRHNMDFAIEALGMD